MDELRDLIGRRMPGDNNVRSAAKTSTNYRQILNMQLYVARVYSKQLDQASLAVAVANTAKDRRTKVAAATTLKKLGVI